jgi:hypothetical protein
MKSIWFFRIDPAGFEPATKGFVLPPANVDHGIATGDIAQAQSTHLIA